MHGFTPLDPQVQVESVPVPPQWLWITHPLQYVVLQSAVHSLLLPLVPAPQHTQPTLKQLEQPEAPELPEHELTPKQNC